jgi:hypothetical protein
MGESRSAEGGEPNRRLGSRGDDYCGYILAWNKDRLDWIPQFLQKVSMAPITIINE